MDERIVSESDRGAVRKDGEGTERTGREQRDGACYFTRQAISEFIQGGGVASTIMSRVYKSPDDLIVEEQPHRKYVVRRLTPLECCRLQGFPDWWTDGAEGSDTAQYKMWGNGIALPCAYDVMRRIVKEFERGNKHGIDDSGTT